MADFKKLKEKIKEDIFDTPSVKNMFLERSVDQSQKYKQSDVHENELSDNDSGKNLFLKIL